MPIKRETIIFGLPLNSESTQSLGSYDDVSVSKSENKIYVRLYINPSSFNISEKKLINKQLTKGGYIVQYWGEELPTIQIQGETGSSGIEGINIVRSIYRHEQIQFKKILDKRLQSITDETSNAFLSNSSDVNRDYKSNAGGVLAGAADFFTGGLFSTLTNGYETLTDIINGDFTLPARKEYSNFSTTASLASLAVSVEIYYQGETFRGYFTNMTVTEQSQSPGLFSYSMSFEVLHRTGIRKNFMPWHRNPIDQATGEPKMTSVPIESYSPNELSFPYDDDFLINDLLPPPSFKKVSPNAPIVIPTPGKRTSVFYTDNEVESPELNLRLKDTKRRG